MIKIFYGRLFLKKPFINDYKDSAAEMEPWKKLSEQNNLQTTSEDATLVVSATNTDVEKCAHYPLIDIDVPINLIPASRIGHTHLYINHPMPQEGLFEILDVLAKWGVVEKGYANASKARGYSAVRLPWVFKNKNIL